MSSKELTGKSYRVFRHIFEEAKRSVVYSIEKKQAEIAKDLNITRQALNIHLKRLRSLSYIKTGRGFINITEQGLNALGILSRPAAILLRTSPEKRSAVYEKLTQLPLFQAWRVAGDYDTIIITDQSDVAQALRDLSKMEGVVDTQSYMCIEVLR